MGQFGGKEIVCRPILFIIPTLYNNKSVFLVIYYMLKLDTKFQFFFVNCSKRISTSFVHLMFKFCMETQMTIFAIIVIFGIYYHHCYFPLFWNLLS